MKQLTEYNRVSGYLNKIFNRLNETYFENALTKIKLFVIRCWVNKKA